MNGKQFVKALEKYREECDKAYSEGDPFPVIEATIPVDAQKQIEKKYGTVVLNLVLGMNDHIESVNEAQNEMDVALETLEYIANGLAESEQLAQQVADITSQAEPVHAGAPEDTPGGDEHKVKGD